MEDGIDFFDALSSFTEVPETVVIDVSRPIRTIYALFSASPEFILDQIVEACSCKTTAYRDIANMTRHLHTDLSQTEEDIRAMQRESGKNNNVWPYPAVSLIDKMITIEQSALDIFHQFDLFKLYVAGGYLPYRYEHVYGDGSLVLRKYQDSDEFFDRVAFLSC